MRDCHCDKCGEVIDLNLFVGDDILVMVTVATCGDEYGQRGEYHRRCARGLTVAEVWDRPGLVVPL